MPSSVVATFPKLAHDWLTHELDPSLFRRNGLIGMGAPVTTGQVLGQVLGTNSATSTANAGNTGDGVLTIDATTPVLAGAGAGTYTVRCITAAVDGGTFQVELPSGAVLGTVAVGATFATDIKFTVADGAADFVVGDTFSIAVNVAHKYVPIDFAAVDGSQHAAAICINGVDATSADRQTAILTGSAQIVPNQLTWPDGATTTQQAAALSELEALGIVDHQV